MDLEKETISEFDSWASSYDKGLWKRYFDRCYNSALCYIDPKIKNRILDLGCGTGDLIKLIEKQMPGQCMTGYDISKKMLDIARQKLTHQNNVTFVRGNTKKLPFNDNEFDYIFCLNSFHHYENQLVSLEEINRVLKIKGKFILLDPFTDNLLRKLWCFVLKVIFKEKYAKYHSKAKLSNWFLKSGFDLIDQKSFMYFTLFTVGRKKDVC